MHDHFDPIKIQEIHGCLEIRAGGGVGRHEHVLHHRCISERQAHVASVQLLLVDVAFLCKQAATVVGIASFRTEDEFDLTHWRTRAGLGCNLVHAPDTVGAEHVVRIEDAVEQTVAVRNQGASETAHNVGLAGGSRCALLEEAGRSSYTVQSPEGGQNSGVTSNELLVDLAAKQTHDVAHTSFDDLDDGFLAGVLELFFLGDNDGRDEVRPLVQSGLHDILHSEGDGLVAGRQLGDRRVVRHSQRALDLDAAVFVLDTTKTLGEVEERDALEELVNFAIANAEQRAREQFI